MAWAPDYTTVARFKNFIRVTDTDDDVQIGVVITSASRAIDKACNRQFGALSSATEWFYTAQYDRHRSCWFVPVDDFATTTGLVVKVKNVATTDYVVEPLQAVAKGMVWTGIRLGTQTGVADKDAIGVTALWGWPSVPPPIEQACWLQASRFHSRRDSPYGIAGSPADGSELRLLATVDPDVRVSLGHYVRTWGVA